MPGIIYVAAGGAIGASARYLISLLPTKNAFPIWTLLINFAGAVLIGFVAGFVSLHKEISPNVSLFWKTGVCGGFTTFSTFSLEALNLLENGKTGMGMVYIVLSVGLCIAGVYLGRAVASM